VAVKMLHEASLCVIANNKLLYQLFLQYNLCKPAPEQSDIWDFHAAPRRYRSSIMLSMPLARHASKRY